MQISIFDGAKAELSYAKALGKIVKFEGKWALHKIKEKDTRI